MIKQSKSEKAKFKRVLKNTLFLFCKYKEIIEKNDLQHNKSHLIELYLQIETCVKTLNIDVLRDLKDTLDKMYNKILLSDNYLINNRNNESN